MADSTKLTLTGAASALAGEPFVLTVTPDEAGPSAADTVTPSDGGAGGTFTPATASIAAGSVTPVTFQYTPSKTSIGSNVTLSVTDSLKLDTTSKLTVPVTQDPDATYSLAGPTGSVVAGAPATLTLKPGKAPASDLVVTLSDNDAGGTFASNTVTLPAGATAAVTVDYTPAKAGPVSISATNDGAFLNPSPLALTVAEPASTKLALSGANTVTAGGSTAVVVTPNNGGPSAEDTVTLSDGGAGGVFTPAALTFAAGSAEPQQVMYKPASSATGTSVSITATDTLNLGVVAPLSVSVVKATIAPYDQSKEALVTSVVDAATPTTDQALFTGYLTAFKDALTLAQGATEFTPAQLQASAQAMWMITNMTCRIGQNWIFDQLLAFHVANKDGCCDDYTALGGIRYLDTNRANMSRAVYGVFRDLALGNPIIIDPGQLTGVTRCPSLINYVRTKTGKSPVL